jgi:glyoxylase-like metal-dependent hydrolase (beta-lactamase superfamily II)
MNQLTWGPGPPRRPGQEDAASIIRGLSTPTHGTLTHGIAWIDLQFLARPRAIATAIVFGDGGAALVDPGPATCLDTLNLGLQARGIRWPDVRQILVTHIHLDHSGGVGTILREHPHITVFVHERGAPHLIDPGKLLDSATRLYGDDMDRLWGRVDPVPAGNVVALKGGERIEAGGRLFDVAYTPGHASHHVSYLEKESGVAFVGDTAGVCVDGGYVLPPTPPPDIDVEAWRGSVDRIEAWAPSTLFLTHFGPAPSVRPHLRALMENLETMAAWVRASLDQPGTDAERAERFAEYLRHDLRSRMIEAQMASYPVAAPFEQLWLGLARYWRKRT